MKRKLKVATRHSHSFPKLACPGGREGTIISTERLNRTVSVDAAKGLMTVESGMVLRDLIHAAAHAGLALPHSPYWYGLTIGGLLATGAHGSSLWGKGSAVHEYVVGMRIVTPAPASQGFAVVRELGHKHPDLDAAKVSLGVLGVVSQVTLQLQPMFKRSVTFVERDDSDFAAQVAVWGDRHEFGDMTWLPRQAKVIYREDGRVDVSSPGNGLNNYLGFRSNPTLGLIIARAAEERLEEDGDDIARCLAALVPAATFRLQGYGFTNDGSFFTGYPLVGYQHRIQASGTCINGKEDGLLSSCPWDPRIRSFFFYNSGFSVALSKAPALVADMQRLRDLNPRALCGLDAKMGVLVRYVRASSAYLGKVEDSVDFDITYYRSYTEGTPRVHSDVIDELEQLALRKYNAVPHWGKNRNFAFDGAIAKYAKAGEFLKVKERYDPDGIFSSEWSDQFHVYLLHLRYAKDVIVSEILDTVRKNWLPDGNHKSQYPTKNRLKAFSTRTLKSPAAIKGGHTWGFAHVRTSVTPESDSHQKALTLARARFPPGASCAFMPLESGRSALTPMQIKLDLSLPSLKMRDS
uniref:L-gulonolactone oxidase n=1 Tax=Aegilops tauschii TaxID=37682 RepID=R7WBB6_AEGTA